MQIIFKAFIEFVKYCFCFMVFGHGACRILTSNHTSCIGSLDRWAYREVLQMCLLLCQRRLGRERCLSIFNTQVHLFICLPWG